MDERILHIVFHKSEADIICWMRSLPPGSINSTVNKILSAESKGTLAKIPYKFSFTSDVEKANCRFVIRTKAALNFVAKIPRGKIKQTLVKVIRKHIRKNSKLAPPPVLIQGDSIVKLLDSFERQTNSKEATYAGMPDKYRFLSERYRLACELLFNEMLKCFDKKQGERKVNIAGIINAAYSSQSDKEQTNLNFKEDNNHERI